MIGYYIHHHGCGHLNRAISICAHLHQPAVALTSLDIPTPHPFADILRLPRDDSAPRPAQTSANGALHWVPHHHHGLTLGPATGRLLAQMMTGETPFADPKPFSVERFG